jgi:type IV secretion system protein VirB8
MDAAATPPSRSTTAKTDRPVNAFAPVTAQHASKYFNDAMDWETSQIVSVQAGAKRDRRVSTGAFALAGLAILAVVGLTPLHRVVTQTVFVDKLTGDAQVATVLDTQQTASINEQVDMYWATRYVKARESYYYPLIQQSYDTTRALSTDEVVAPYIQQFEGRDSKDKRLGNNTIERINIISARPSESNVAIVDYEVETRRGDNNAITKPPERYIASVRFEYRPPTIATKQKDRVENPLGFKVVGYRSDAELSAPGSTPADAKQTRSVFVPPASPNAPILSTREQEAETAAKNLASQPSFSTTATANATANAASGSTAANPPAAAASSSIVTK